MKLNMEQEKNEIRNGKTKNRKSEINQGNTEN